MRILAFQALPYLGTGIYWERDMGALVNAWRREGHDASLVLFEKPGIPAPAGLPLILTDRARAADPAWWRDQRPEAVVFNTWGASRCRPFWEAARLATPRVIDRLDTDGIRSPRVELHSYLFAMWSRMKDVERRRWRRPLAWPYTLAHWIAQRAFPAALDRKMAAALASLPAVTAESPIAAVRIARFQRLYGHRGDNVHCVPHPVVEEELPDPVSLAKEKVVASVGRWDSHQKNVALLCQVLREFLRCHPGWRAEIVGVLGRNERRCRETVGDLPVTFTGPRPHAEVFGLLARSRIFLMSSRHESFNIAAAEALCCGAAVVAPAHIPTATWFAGDRSGTVAPRYTPTGLLDALVAEAAAWDSGQRSGERIARAWRQRLVAREVGRQIVAILNNLATKTPEEVGP